MSLPSLFPCPKSYVTVNDKRNRHWVTKSINDSESAFSEPCEQRRDPVGAAQSIKVNSKGRTAAALSDTSSHDMTWDLTRIRMESGADHATI